jgi:hypothetical protein
MDGIVATAFPQIGSEDQRTDKNRSGSISEIRAVLDGSTFEALVEMTGGCRS